MSKLCNDDNVQATLDHYTELGVSVEAKPVTLTNKNKNEGTALWAVKVKEESTDLDGKSYAAGKVLKSVDYTPADLSKLWWSRPSLRGPLQFGLNWRWLTK